jgi:hypothetical protein
MGSALLIVAVGACASDDDHDHEHGDHDHDEMVGPPSGAECPSDRTGLTYEAFGKNFMEQYCTRCHSTTLTTPAARMGATPDHDFDVLAGIRGVREHIDQMAAAGPTSTNTRMPPASDSGPKPTLEERTKLGQWLACEFGTAD